jgi:hypothetical protein
VWFLRFRQFFIVIAHPTRPQLIELLYRVFRTEKRAIDDRTQPAHN